MVAQSPQAGWPVTAFIDKVAWLHIVDRRVLFARSKGQPLFFTVGGNRDWLGLAATGRWETDVETLVREVREECGVEVDPGTATFAVEVHGPSLYEWPLRLRCYFAKKTGDIVPSGEIEEVKFLGYGDGRLTTETGRMVLNWLYRQPFIGR